jgi:hypothetical protein
VSVTTKRGGGAVALRDMSSFAISFLTSCPRKRASISVRAGFIAMASGIACAGNPDFLILRVIAISMTAG